jgi:hypothetical protein
MVELVRLGVKFFERQLEHVALCWRAHTALALNLAYAIYLTLAILIC